MLNTTILPQKTHGKDEGATIKVLLADAHTMMREGLRTILDGQDDMEVVGEASEGRILVEKAQRFLPHIIVLDEKLPRPAPIRAMTELRKHCPDTRVIMLISKERVAPIRELFELGAASCVLNCSPCDELIRAIRMVATGGVYIDPALTAKFLGGLAWAPGRNGNASQRSLSGRETEALSRIACGYSSKEIAVQLSLSVKTVETYKSRSMKKLDLNSRVDLMRFARDHGWFDDL